MWGWGGEGCGGPSHRPTHTHTHTLNTHTHELTERAVEAVAVGGDLLQHKAQRTQRGSQRTLLEHPLCEAAAAGQRGWVGGRVGG